MASILNILSITTIFLALAFQAYGQTCSLSNIQVSETKTETGYTVRVTNNCSCMQSKIKFSCVGFKPSQPVDPNLLTQGQDCLLIHGKPLFLAQVITFTYVSDTRFSFIPKSSEITCH
ncbi:uncharacterized protein LOC131645227 [Vicia villosa]|uniref:uncharacterized protein LOC131645227 n=1 Tax=Vicia villosa TaxID=3911 RepID=UPI00273A8804|nr:uncharacterized protein LOC131645227 [Vicia villosa]